MRIYRIAVILLVATIVYLFRLLFLAAAAVLYVYFLPSLLTEKRNPSKIQTIFVINLVAGWMLFPWIIALVWAYKMDSVPQSTA
ncbi:MAG: superinfection immunity protein [Massilia sp.]